MDITKILGAPACWVECMKLNPHDQTDPEGCKIRPGEGMTAIGELAPGNNLCVDSSPLILLCTEAIISPGLNSLSGGLAFFFL